MTGGVGGIQGSLAEYAAVDEALLAPKPASLSMREAAALPLAVITAWEGLVDRAAMRPGQKILVHGGAGGVGHVAVQIALARGAEVFATHRGRHEAYLRSLGAVPIDTERAATRDYVREHTDGRGFDVVYDTVGDAALEASFEAVRRYGHVVSALGRGTHSLASLSLKGASYSGVFTLIPLLTGDRRAHHGTILAEAAELANAGKLRPRIDPRQFDTATIEDAYMAQADGSAEGKIVVSVA
jgi:NADPH:quinone reductase-like Zn-dependent oxidoreductase